MKVNAEHDDGPPQRSEECGRFCTGPDELQDALGHDALGHMTTRQLRRARVTTLADLRALSPADIVGIRGVGRTSLDRIERQGLLGDEFRTRPGHRALLHFQAASGVRLTQTETHRLMKLIDFAREQDWDVVGMSISSGQHSVHQAELALKDLREGRVDHLGRWDHDANKPVVTSHQERRP
ncbi:hypothetical protein ACFW5V_31930 [Streptomyces sp. NPDC058762]|uniref:hypothetical protein n=1 Tax=Streptomyces sp. NPDC058762 TaxID=3346629 RepID=UPI00368AD23A